jgi:CheY-like chemotaxis protein
MASEIQEKIEKTIEIALYSDDASVREIVKKALGSRIAPDLPPHTISEFATGPALRSRVDSGHVFDLYILDGESVPEGGLGIAKQLKDEVFNCGTVIVLVGRASDAWLAGWSRAEGVISHPVDPFTIAATVAEIFRKSRVSA